MQSLAKTKNIYTLKVGYYFYGSNLDDKKQEKAVNLSVE